LSDDLSAWLKPLLARLGHKARRRMCPLFVAELIEPGERKSVGPTVERLAPGAYDQLHHFAPERSVGRLRSTSRAKARPRAKSAR
jgi:DDE superfamily endonuclease